MSNSPYIFREIGIGHYPFGIYDLDKHKVQDIMKLKDESKKGKLLYLHIPFCESICPFCPYPKTINSEESRNAYLDALCREIELYSKEPQIRCNSIEAIYFGGGTPSVLTEREIETLFNRIKDYFDLKHVEEITFEGNPASFTRSKTRLLKSLGVNRVSLGVQTFDDKLGDSIGLIQSEKHSVEAIEWCKEAGIENISIDMMYNLPAQTKKGWETDLSKIGEYGVNHVSLFPLKVIPGFTLFKHIQSNQIPACGSIEFEKELFSMGWDILESYGYHIESTYDFAQPGKQHIYSRKHFWQHKDLLAVGMGVFGEINRCIYQNVGSVSEYVKKLGQNEFPIARWYTAQEKDLPYQYLAMGFRLLCVDRNEFKEKFGEYPEEKFKDIFEKLCTLGLVEIQGGNAVLTKKDGVFWGNNVCKEFCEDIFKKVFPK